MEFTCIKGDRENGERPPHWTVRSCMGNEIGTAKLPTVDGMWLPHRDADPEANDSATFYN